MHLDRSVSIVLLALFPVKCAETSSLSEKDLSALEDRETDMNKWNLGEDWLIDAEAKANLPGCRSKHARSSLELIELQKKFSF